MKPRILVACEYSGRVRDEFAARGWDAWSCDFEESDTVGQHYRGDVRDLLKQHWDMLIAFPPCTYLCGSGMHWTTRGLRDPKLTEEALAFVHLLMKSPPPPYSNRESNRCYQHSYMQTQSDNPAISVRR